MSVYYYLINEDEHMLLFVGRNTARNQYADGWYVFRGDNDLEKLARFLEFSRGDTLRVITEFDTEDYHERGIHFFEPTLPQLCGEPVEEERWKVKRERDNLRAEIEAERGLRAEEHERWRLKCAEVERLRESLHQANRVLGIVYMETPTWTRALQKLDEILSDTLRGEEE
jgi:hypothetical protein